MSYAVELIESMDDKRAMADLLSCEISSLGSSWGRDFFPAPGGSNRQPDFEARYEDILAAVETVPSSPRSRRRSWLAA